MKTLAEVREELIKSGATVTDAEFDMVCRLAISKLKTGTESNSYEPSMADVVNAALALYLEEQQTKQ